MSGQTELDTRAIELASQAVAKADAAKEHAEERVRAHETLCAERHKTLNANITRVGDSIDSHAVTTDQNLKTLYGRWWMIMVGIMGVMTTIIGVLFVKSYG